MSLEKWIDNFFCTKHNRDLKWTFSDFNYRCRLWKKFAWLRFLFRGLFASWARNCRLHSELFFSDLSQSTRLELSWVEGLLCRLVVRLVGGYFFLLLAATSNERFSSSLLNVPNHHNNAHVPKKGNPNYFINPLGKNTFSPLTWGRRENAKKFLRNSDQTFLVDARKKVVSTSKVA